MSFRALLVTKDDQAAEVLTPVLSNFGLGVQRCGYSDAVCLVTEQKFQGVLVDFDDPHSAALVLQNLASAPFQTNAVTIALLSEKNKVRNVFGKIQALDSSVTSCIKIFYFCFCSKIIGAKAK